MTNANVKCNTAELDPGPKVWGTYFIIMSDDMALG